MSLQATSEKRQGLTPGVAMRIAWLAYVVLLLLPFVLFANVFALYSSRSPAPLFGEAPWFLLSMAYLAVAVPAALFYRSRVCRDYARGGVVAPVPYLAGMLTVWLSLEIGVALPVVGCYATGSFLPMLLPAFLALVFFLTQWPGGRMMIGHTGDSEDPEIFEEPR